MPPQAQSEKILIVVPFWKKDRGQAIAMVRLLADIEPRHSTQADILFVRRFDSPPMPPDVIKYVSRKFNVLQHRSARRETGWPLGCNGLFFGSVEYIYSMLYAGRIPNYRAIFNMASDVVPLQRDWLDYLHREWIRVSTGGAASAGALIDGEHQHINGDAFLFSSKKVLKWLATEVGSVSIRAGWDWILAAHLRGRGWANMPGVSSFWNTPTMSYRHALEWRKRGVVILHGVKDDSLLRHARKILL